MLVQPRHDQIPGLVYLSAILDHKPAKIIRIARKIYPQAAAYISAAKYAESSHPKKAAIGRKTLDAIITGGDYVRAVKIMRKTWHDYALTHIVIK